MKTATTQQILKKAWVQSGAWKTISFPKYVKQALSIKTDKKVAKS